jgi:hypothetical protein
MHALYWTCVPCLEGLVPVLLLFQVRKGGLGTPCDLVRAFLALDDPPELDPQARVERLVDRVDAVQAVGQ